MNDNQRYKLHTFIKQNFCIDGTIEDIYFYESENTLSAPLIPIQEVQQYVAQELKIRLYLSVLGKEMGQLGVPCIRRMDGRKKATQYLRNSPSPLHFKEDTRYIPIEQQPTIVKKEVTVEQELLKAVTSLANIAKRIEKLLKTQE